MSLSPDWFEMRAARMDHLDHDQGHVELETFMRACGFSWDDLVAAGLLRHKQIMSTAELLAHEPTAKGANLLVRDKTCDILMVKKGKGLGLVDAVRATAKSSIGRKA
jgi:hypothetical protein